MLIKTSFKIKYDLFAHGNLLICSCTFPNGVLNRQALDSFLCELLKGELARVLQS